MKVSIITATYNSAATVRNTIESVLSQDYEDIEYLIVDGGSTDDTLGIVRRYGNRISSVVSEPDRGIYDALNKGIALATGEVVAILNSDDYYADNTIISAAVQTLEENHVDTCYGDLVYVDAVDTGRVLRRWKSGDYSPVKFFSGWMPPHPTFFVRKKIYEKYGDFNLTLGTAADYEIMLRFLLKNGVTTSYIPRVLVRMRAGGASNVNLVSRLRANYYDRVAWRVNDIRPRPWTLLFKPLRKVVQFVVK